MTTVPKPSSLSSGLTCKWDAWNHLVEVKDGTTVVAKYEYDGLARRVKKHVDSQSPGSPDGIDAYVHFFYNRGWQVLETRRSTVENTGPESPQVRVSIRLVAAHAIRFGVLRDLCQRPTACLPAGRERRYCNRAVARGGSRPLPPDLPR